MNKLKTAFVVIFLFCAVANFSDANAEWVIPSGFTQVRVDPAEFPDSHSTILSVTTSPDGQTFASVNKRSGGYLSTVPFDGTPSTATQLPFVTRYYVVDGMRFAPDGVLHLLILNYRGPGAVRRAEGGEFPVLLEFGSEQRFSRALAIDSIGNLLVAGSAGDTGWILKYDAFGSLILDFDVSHRPIGLACDSQDQAYVATHNGEVFAISDAGDLTLVAQLSNYWVGPGKGHVISFAIDSNDNFFMGISMGQRYNMNSGAILRVSRTGETDAFGFGIPELPEDMEFGPDGDLMVACFHCCIEGSTAMVFKFSGDFGALEFDVTEPIGYEVPVDIKPQSCPNPINTKKKGITPVAILGTGDPNFDVERIYVDTIRLEGVAPLSSYIEDVGTPYEPYLGKQDTYACNEEGPDGINDLVLKFDTQQIIKALGDVQDGQVMELKLTGLGGYYSHLWVTIGGEDVVVIIHKVKD